MGINFSQTDVIKVAQALVDTAVEREYQGDYGKHEFLYRCNCCGEEHPEEPIKHKTTCEVLIAQDLLTGVK